MNLIDRKRVRDQVAGCRACKLTAQCSGPVPFSAPASTRIMVIGEAPGAAEDKQGKPFVGPAGTLLRRELRRLGLDVESVAYANVVSCWPNRQPATPTRGEMEACRQNLVDQIAVVDPEFMLLTGATAVSSYWKLTMGTVRGSWWQLNSGERVRWCLATCHPAAVLRDRGLRDRFVAELESFLLGFCFGPWRNWWCARCGAYTTISVGLDGIVDSGCDWGVPLCAKCLSKSPRPFAAEGYSQGKML